MIPSISRLLFLCAVFLVPLFGQNYSATTGDVVLAGAGTKFSIQQPATNGRQVQLIAAVVYCSVACDLTQVQNGTAATATAATATRLLPGGGATATATVWTASNSTGGSAAGGILHIVAGERLTIDLSHVAMGSSDTNYSFVVSSITGTANIAVFWSEK